MKALKSQPGAPLYILCPVPGATRLSMVRDSYSAGFSYEDRGCGMRDHAANSDNEETLSEEKGTK